MTNQPPSAKPGAQFGRLRFHRRIGLYVTGAAAMAAGLLCAFGPTFWPNRAFLPSATSLFAAIFVASGTLALAAGMFGRFGLATTARKERRSSSAAASVMLWLWTFGIVSAVLFTWRLLDLIGPALPDLLPHDHRVKIVRESVNGRTMTTVIRERDGKEN